MSRSDTTYKELKAGWKNEVNVQHYSTADISKHNNKHDQWIVIHGKVYDVTKYSRDHPGGADILLEVAGTDATSAYEDVGHSEDAGEIMQSFLVGLLEGYTGPTAATKSHPVDPAKVIVNRDSTSKTNKQTRSPLSLRLELILLAGGTAGLTQLITHYHLLPSLHTFMPEGSSGIHLKGSFMQGFISATLALGLSGILAATYFNKALSNSKSFQAYPAHRPSTKPKSVYHPAGTLDPSAYQQFRLRKREELSPGIYHFVFDLPTRDSILGLPIGQHVAIKASIDEHTVVRSYTPISNNRDLGRLELLIRVYPKGAMGNYLKNLPIGSSVDIRGPKGAMKYRRNMSREIGMVGGGTGITPLYQVIRAICEDDNDNTKISLIYGNRSESDIMLLEKMDALARKVPHKLEIYYTLDQPTNSWTGGRGHVTKDTLKEKLPLPTSASKVLLCGPPGMVEAVKNNLVELGYDRPGAVAKVTDHIFCF